MTEREALQELVDCWVEAGPSMLARWADAWADAKEVLGRPAVDDPVAAMWAKVDAAKAGDPVSAVQDQLAGRPAPAAPADDLVRRLLVTHETCEAKGCVYREAADRIEALQSESNYRWTALHKAEIALDEAADRIVALEYKVELLRAELQLCRTVEPGSGEGAI